MPHQLPCHSFFFFPFFFKYNFSYNFKMVFTIFNPINATHYLFIYLHYHPIINLTHYLFIYFHYHPIYTSPTFLFPLPFHLPTIFSIFLPPLPFHLPTTLYVNIILPLFLHLLLFFSLLIHTL